MGAPSKVEEIIEQNMRLVFNTMRISFQLKEIQCVSVASVWIRRILDKRVPDGDNQRALVDHNKKQLADKMRELETYGLGRMTNPSLIKAATEMAASQCSTDDNRLSGVSGGGSTFNEATGWMVERHSTINGGGSGARNSMQNIVSHLILFYSRLGIVYLKSELFISYQNFQAKSTFILPSTQCFSCKF